MLDDNYPKSLEPAIYGRLARLETAMADCVQTTEKRVTNLRESCIQANSTLAYWGIIGFIVLLFLALIK